MDQMLLNADTWLLHQINNIWTNPALDRLLPTVTDFGAWGPVFLVLGLSALIFGNTRLRLLCVAIGLAVGLGDSIISASLKKLTNRLRPHEAISGITMRVLPKSKPKLLAVFQAPIVREGSPAKPGSKGRSFPSSHTVNMWAVATACWLVYGRRAWWVGVIAFLVAWSRIYCGSHWPSDIAAGIGLGILCGWAGVWIIDKLWDKYAGVSPFKTAPASGY